MWSEVEMQLHMHTKGLSTLATKSPKTATYIVARLRNGDTLLPFSATVVARNGDIVAENSDNLSNVHEY